MRSTWIVPYVLVLALILAASSSSSQVNPEATPKAEKAAPGVAVTEAKLGTDVQNRELVGEATQFEVNQKVYLWLKITGGTGEDLTVTWKQGDKTYATTLKVGGSPWRTWAYKTAAIAGTWTVTVSDASGNALKELEFTAGAPPAK